MASWGNSARQRLRLRPLATALALAGGARARPAPSRGECEGGWAPGISVVIPERDAPEMLGEALESVAVAARALDEPIDLIVVANGAAADRYAGVREAYPEVRWVHSDAPLGFSAAIGRGLGIARHAWSFLMNNDVTLEPETLTRLARERAAGVFSISAQILQQSRDGRREETGFTDWYVDTDGIHVFHAPVPVDEAVCPHLAGSGGATLFRTAPLMRYVREAACYDPFYWEDIEWGRRAWGDGYRVLFCPPARAHHRHRATTARFYDAATINRIVARNALLFDLRNAATPYDTTWLMRRVCDLDYRSQRDLSRPRIAWDVLRRRREARRRNVLPPPPMLPRPAGTDVQMAESSFSYRLTGFTPPRPRLLLVTPFAAFPPRHGGARRIAGLLAELRADHHVILVTDEASLYDARSFSGFDGLAAIHLVQRGRDTIAADAKSLEARMRSHTHSALVAAVRAAQQRYEPQLVQVEFAELAPLVRERRAGERWILSLHDAYGPADFGSPEAARTANGLVDAYDAVTVCSEEDRALVTHRDVTCIPNASSIAPGLRRPSSGARLLFMGPFRYAPNYDGVRAFLQHAWPVVKRGVPAATLRILGGDGALKRSAGDPLFAADGVEVLEHRDDVAAQLDACALTINPLEGIRGSPVKLVESLAAGRACVSTVDGARGFAQEGLAALITAESVAAMAAPIIRLLADPTERQRIEATDPARLATFTWARSAAQQRALYERLRATRDD